MSSELIERLYYFGFVSSLFFGLRFAIQWLYSETAGKSVVPKSFWWLSILGNITLLIHSLIQMQFHVALVQSLNGVISWRNLDFMSNKPKSFRFTLVLLLCSGALCVLYFVFFSSAWFAIPSGRELNFGWHLFGMLGIFLFSSRFIVQWWQTEKAKKSTLSLTFWWMSFIGGLFSLVYFAKISDPVNLIGPAIGIIPYFRNLMLLYKKEPEAA